MQLEGRAILHSETHSSGDWSGRRLSGSKWMFFSRKEAVRLLAIRAPNQSSINRGQCRPRVTQLLCNSGEGMNNGDTPCRAGGALAPLGFREDVEGDRSDRT